MCCKCCSVKQRKAWIYGLSTFFVTLGIILLFLWSNLAESMVENNLILRRGGEVYNYWIAAPIPIYLTFYMFNWTNPEEVRNSHVKPHFAEMGPYVFLEKRLKENITFHSNDTVSFYQRKTWFFQPQLSNGSLNDMVTSGHAITATVAEDMRDSNKFLKRIINFIFNHEGGMLHTTKRVGEWIFDGYQDKLLDFLNHFNTTKTNIPYKRFGWMVERNDSLTYDGSFTVYTGVKGIKNLGLLTHWNNKNESGLYPLPCGIVNGSTGDLFPPHLDTKSEITIFITDACRFINLQPTGKVEKFGLSAFEWVGTNETLDSGENFPNQQCFCNPKIEVCPKTGVVNCKKCINNAPILASFPHLYLADQSYIDAVEGLTPNANKHKFTLTVEPTTGIPVEIHGRLQMNMRMMADEDFDLFRNINEFVMPLFWLDQTAHITPDLAQRAKMALSLVDYGRYSAIVFICVGLGLFAIGIILTYTKRWSAPIDYDEVMLTN